MTKPKEPRSSEIISSEKLSDLDLQDLIEDTTVPQTETKAALRYMKASFKGPLPPPHLLRQYQSIDPDLIEWFKKYAEQEAELTRSLVQSEIDATKEDHNDRKRGQHYALLIIFSFLAVGIFLILLGHTTPGVILSPAGLIMTGLARLFIQGRGNTTAPPNEEE